MEKLQLNKTKASPEVLFDPNENIFEFNGVSYSENPLIYFDIIMKWLTEYGKFKPKRIILNVQVYYLNTSSTHLFVKMIKLMSEICDDFFINWKYDEDDIEIYELGKDIEYYINNKINYICLI